MKMLIEKQAAAAARLNSPSRLEAFAADSPPHRRRPRTPTSARGGGGEGGEGGGGGGGAVSPLPRCSSSGGIALSELISATTPPRRRGAMNVEAGSNVGGHPVGSRGGGEAARRSLAQETYTKTFSGMQA